MDAMQRTLSQHIADLEQKVVYLKRVLRGEDLSVYQRAERELALLNAEESLNLFRRAYEVELRVPKISE
jgi:hypothetical protein